MGAYQKYLGELALEIERLNARIKELEEMERADREEIGSYIDGTGLRGEWQEQGAEINKLENRILELEEGSCRFNCRTKKEAFIAGFDAAVLDAEDGIITCEDLQHEVAKEAYKEWLGER